MSTLTGKDLNLVKPALTDDHKVTIGTDLPANFQKIDDEFTAHLAETVSDIDGVHGLIIERGNWTPSISAATTAPTTLNVVGVRGTYDRIGNIVKCSGFIRFSVTDGSGNLELTDFPFVCKAMDESGVISIFKKGSAKVDVQGLFQNIVNSDTFIFRNGNQIIQISDLYEDTVDIAFSVTYRMV